tara:strand:- start:1651 stop:1812 length:162 start_codon:yes stop_codon:yes gene_type:complete
MLLAFFVLDFHKKTAFHKEARFCIPLTVFLSFFSNQYHGKHTFSAFLSFPIGS